MQINKTIALDFGRRGVAPVVDVVQNDVNTRIVTIKLFYNGVAWPVPDGVGCSLAFRRPDGGSGWYDTLPDGSDACVVAGNTVTVTLVEAMLTAAGRVRATLVLRDEEMNQLGTFGFIVSVDCNPAAGAALVNAYYNVKSLGDLNRVLDEMNSRMKRLEENSTQAGGENGVTFMPAVAADGTLSWTNNGGLDNPAPVNIMGPQGKTGDTGPEGPQGAPAVSPVARVTETEEGVEISITDEFGTSKATVLHGKDGEQGKKGDTGEKGEKGDTGEQGPQGIQGIQGKQGMQGVQGEAGRTPGIWLAPEDDSAFILQYGVVVDHLVGTVAAAADTVFAGDMILCKDGGVLLVKGFDENDSDWVLCQGAKDEADLTAGAAVSLKGTDGKDGNLIWLTEDSTDSVQMDGVYFTHLTGAKDATMETVFPGDLLITADGDLVRIKSVMELNNDSLGVAMVGGNVISLKGADGAPGAAGTTPVLTIGTVETGEPGSDAAAIITGTAENPVLSMIIPRGADGAGGGSSTTVVTVGFASSCNFICDGVDDDVEIQAAIDSLPDSGGTVKLVVGDYYLSNTIASAKNNVRIVGEVNSTTTVVSSKPSVNLHGSKTLFNPSGWNWQFCEISLLGENATSWGKYGLNLQNAKGSIRVERCVLSGWNGGVNGAGTDNGKDLTVDGCAVTGCTYGVNNPENATVTGCVIDGCDHGIYGPVGCALRGNTILDCGVGIGPIDNGKNTITGNTITRGTGTAADYAADQHTILLGQLDLDGKTMLYGFHNSITGNFLYGKDVTVEETTQEAALAELASCIVRANMVMGAS